MTASERFVRRQADGAAARLAQVERALAEVAAGRMVIVLDDSGEQSRGHLVFAAQVATAELMAFTVRHTCGFVCVSIAESDADRLQLPAQFHTNQDSHGTAYAVTVDAREGVGTGISATDRAHTVRLLGDPASRADQLSRPGHVVPVRALPGGVLRRAGNTEAAMDLARLAGLHPAGVLSEIVNDDGSVAGPEDLRDFATEHGLVIVRIADLIAYRRVHEKQFEAVAEARIPTAHGPFRAVGYRSVFGDREHLALVRGELGEGEDVLVRVHTECLIGDAFGSLRCECHARLDDSLAAVAAEGRGVVLYLRAQDGAESGLVQKLQAYQRCDLGADSVDVAGDPGRADVCLDTILAQMLSDLGVRSVRPSCDAEPRREPA